MAARRRFDRAELRRLHGAGATTTEMAAALGVSAAAVRGAIAHEGLPRPGRVYERSASIDLILARIDTSTEHWVWPGAMHDGIARSSVERGRTTASVPHSLWEHFVADLGARHLRRACDVERCVRPSHHIPGPGTSVGRRAQIRSRAVKEST